MEHVLLVVQVIVTLAMIIAILIQRSDSDGFGLSSGGGNNLFTGRAAANTMTRITAILATIFMANALLLGVLAAHTHSSSIVDTLKETTEETAPVVPAADAEKVAPEAEKKLEKKAPKVPAADAEKPAVPEVDAGEKAKE